MNITLDHFLPHLTVPFTSSQAVLELPCGDVVTGQVFEGVLGEVSVEDQPGFYALYVKHTGQFYFGSTQNLAKRLTAHKSTLLRGIHKNPQFRRLDLNHPDFLIEFKAFVLDDAKQALDIEQSLVDKMWGSPKLMNVRVTDVRYNTGLSHSEEAIEKMKLTLQSRRPLSSEHKDKISRSLKARELDPSYVGVGLLNKARFADPVFSAKWRERSGIKKVSAGGIVYESISDLARAHSISTSTAHRRVHSKYADWKFIEEHKAITQEAA